MTVTGGTRIDRGVGLATHLERHGAATAVVDVDGRPWSYQELARRADQAAAQLGDGRRLVVLEATNDLDGIAWYLGALRHGHVVLLVAPDQVAGGQLIDAYDPDLVVGAGGSVVERRPGSAHDLHPELALLLSTSGSTGSPKLVRLSGANLDANAASIAEYLGLHGDDRAITSLPLQYCYGLSVLHSHLLVGASVTCTPASVVDPCFWDAVDRDGVTNLAGVPHTFELLERAGFADRSHPTLRLLTQAGGRMRADQVRRFARLGQRRGFDLYVMYGQTEATARMAYLPPELAEHRPEAVGVPVPGGSFRIEPLADGPTDEGELVYSGPNVMLGYATGPADLALGRSIDELRTGDVARIGDDGVVEIVGRRRDFLKVFGLRIDLRQVRALLDRAGVDAEVGGDDDGVVVAVTDATPVDEVHSLVREHTALPAPAVAVAAVADLPRLPNGKVDARELIHGVRRTSEPAGSDAPGGSVAALFERLLGRPPAAGDTFVSMGGDSLTYVEASIHLERLLGDLPDDWHHRPVEALEPLASDRPVRRSRVARVETGALLRAVAIVLVVAQHTGTFVVGGGAHVLFAAAGFNVARFQLGSGAWARSIARVAVPSVAWIGAVAATTDDFDLAHALLLHGWIGGRGRWAYWFVEVLVQVLVVLAVAFAIPAVRRAERRWPLALPATLLVPALAVRFDVVDLGAHHRPFFRPHEIAWIFLLGWAAARARTRGQRVALSVVAVAGTVGFFGNPTREQVLLAGLLALLWLPSVPVPCLLPRLLAPLASASLYVYLTHVQVHPLLSDRWPAAGLVASIAVGIGVWRVAQPAQRWLERRSGMAGSPGWSPST